MKRPYWPIYHWGIFLILRRRVWRYQRGNQNPYIEEEQTIQWSKEKVQKDNQRSTKHTHKTTDRVLRTPIKTGGVLRCSGRVRSFCTNSDTRRVNLATNPVINEERTGKWLRQVEHIRGYLWHRSSISVNHVMVATVNFRSDDFNLTKRNHGFSNFLVSSNPLSRKSW
jgi:hypothetical protein